jgi:hypothetical protein
VTSRVLCVLCGALVLALGLTVAFVVTPSATGTPGQDTTPTTTPDPPPTTTPPAPDPAPVRKPTPRPAPKPAPKPTPTPKATAVQPASTQASTNAPTYTPPVQTSPQVSSAPVKSKAATHKVKPKRSRKARESGVLASQAVRVRSVGATAPLAPPKLAAIAPARRVVDAAAIFVAALLALSLLLIGFVAVPMTFIRSHALVHVRWAYGSGIGTVGCALLLIALATLVLSAGGH